MTMTGSGGGESDNDDEAELPPAVPFHIHYLLHRSSKSEKPGQGNTAHSTRRRAIKKAI